MPKLVLALFGVLACCSAAYGTRAVNNPLGQSDINRLQKVFVDGLASNDLQSIYYSTLNVEATNPADKQAICGRLNKLHEESKINDFEKDFYYVGAHKNLRCSEKLSDALLSKINAAFKADLTSAQEIYYRVATHKILGKQVDEAAVKKILKVLQELLKKDDSLVNLGYSFNVVSDLNKNADAAFVADRVEDAIAQADEVDGKMLQFEGGLSITALVVNGAFKITKAYGKPTPISAVQAVKLATYFLSRRSVQTAKGAHVLLEALKTLSNAGQISPICVQHIGNGQLEPESPVLNIAVVDLLGKALSPNVQNVYGKVIKKDNSVLAEKIKFTSKSSDKTVFTADLSTYKPARGAYTVDVGVDNVYPLSLQFKVLGRVKVSSLEIGVAEPDASSLLNKQSLSYPNTLTEALEADSTQKVVLKVVLVDEITAKPINVHQAFVRFYNKEADKEIIFVAEQDSSKHYKFDMDVGARGADFGYHSGMYQIFLIVGDAALSNSFQWHVANVDLKYAQDSRETKKQPIRSALPEIQHLFREPDKRPPRLVSDIFTGLCLTPLVLLFLFWGKLGINVSNFSFSLSTIGFHVGFGGILTLFAIFWLQLNMFQTLRLLIPFAVLTFLCGNRLLRRIYAQRVMKSGGAPSSSS